MYAAEVSDEPLRLWLYNAQILSMNTISTAYARITIPPLLQSIWFRYHWGTRTASHVGDVEVGLAAGKGETGFATGEMLPYNFAMASGEDQPGGCKNEHTVVEGLM